MAKQSNIRSHTHDCEQATKARNEMSDRMMASRYASHLPLSIYCDAKIIVQGETIEVHRAVLAGKSPVFHRMFSSYGKNDQIVLDNISSSVFRQVLEFLYTNELKICCPHSAIILLEPAQRYLIDSLLDELQEWLMKNVQLPDFCELFMIADIYGLPHLKHSFKQRIASQLDVISLDASFPRLNIRLVEELLRCSADLEKIRRDVTYELEAVTAIVRWLELRGGYARIEGVQKCRRCMNLDRNWVRTNMLDWSASGRSGIGTNSSYEENRMHYEERLLNFVDLKNASDHHLNILNHIAETYRLGVLRLMVHDAKESRYQAHPWCDCK